MADLGTSKIKDTYQLVLQSDASGNLQKLDGTTPSLVFNSAFKYNVGSLVDGYVLISDGTGNASWGPVDFSGDIYISGGTIEGTIIELQASSGGTVSIPGLCWSANTDGSISPSGSTTIQTEGDLRVSGTVYTNNITTTATSTDTLIIQSDMIDFQSHGGSIDYLRVKDDAIQLYLDSLQAVTFHSPSHASPGFIFNTSSQNLPFKIFADDTTCLFRTYADTNAVHIRDHVMISSADGAGTIDWSDWGLTVTGSSLFYSGGTSTPSNAITAVGNISGATDLYIGANIYSGTTNLLDIFSDNAGTVTSVTGTAPVVSSGGNTPAISVTTSTVAEDGTNLATGGQIATYVAGAQAGSTRAITVADTSEDTDYILTFTTEAVEAARLYSAANLKFNPFERNLTSTYFTGELVGNAATSTKIASITNTNIVQLDETQTLTNKTLTTPVLGTPTSGTLTNCTFPTLNQDTTGTSNNEDVYMFSNRGQGQTDATHWYGPNFQGLYNYSWSKDYGDDTEVLTLDEEFINAGLLVPYDCVLTGFFTIGHTNTGTAGYSCGLWYITQSNLASSLNVTSGVAGDATLTLAGSIGTTVNPGNSKNPLTLDKRGTMSVTLAVGSMIYPRVGDSAVVTDTTWNVYLKRT